MKNLLTLISILFTFHLVSAQTTSWQQPLNEEENFVAAGGTKYFTVSRTPYNNRIYTVRSYNSGGSPLLATTIFPNSPYTQMTIVKVLATASDDLFILGNINDGVTYRAVLIRLNSSLLQPWMNEISNGLKTYAKDIAIKGSGVIALTSFYPTLTGGTRAGLTTFSIASGAVSQSTTTSFDFAPKQMVVDGNMMVYVCGGSEINLNQARVVKFNSSLSVAWNFLTTMTANATSLTPFEFIQVDVSGNVYAGGNSYNNTYGVFRNEVKKLSPAGTLLSSYTSTNISSHEIMKAMKLNISGQLYYVSKMQSTSTTYANHRIVKLSTVTPLTFTGSFSTIGSWPSYDVTITGFEVTQGGAVFVTGKRTGTTTSTNNYLTIKLRTNFTHDFTEQINGGRCNSVVKAIPGAYPNDEFVTTGIVGNFNMLIKYTAAPAKFQEIQLPNIEPEDLSVKCYPNPAGSEFFIVGTGESAIIQISDINGKVIHETGTDYSIKSVNERIRIDSAQLPSGVYLVKVLDGNKYHHTKVVVSH